MDLPIYLPTKKVFVHTFFFGNSMATIWTYVQNFKVFFYWTLSLLNLPYSVTNSY